MLRSLTAIHGRKVSLQSLLCVSRSLMTPHLMNIALDAHQDLCRAKDLPRGRPLFLARLKFLAGDQMVSLPADWLCT